MKAPRGMEDSSDYYVGAARGCLDEESGTRGAAVWGTVVQYIYTLWWRPYGVG